MNGSTVTSDVVQKELEYRRKKQWDIFSWSSTVFVAITGGVIVLETREKAYRLHSSQKVAISVAVIALVMYAVLWLSHNLTLEASVAELLGQGANAKLRGEKRPLFGYRGAIVLLAIAALFATWFTF